MRGKAENDKKHEGNFRRRKEKAVQSDYGHASLRTTVARKSPAPLHPFVFLFPRFSVFFSFSLLLLHSFRVDGLIFCALDMSGSFREGSSLFIDVSEGSNIVHRGKLSELYRSSIISPAATAVAAASMATAAGPSPTPGNNGVLYGSTAGCLTPSNVAAPLSIPPAGSTVSATPMARMKTYATSNVAQQTRHARRIYCGGIPPNFTDEDGLRNFINVVIAQGLGEENDHSYVLSVYINHKKCFAFVELKSIELATACLELDGIIFRNIVLRILRANEYKPELVVAHQTKNIHFDTSGFQFGTPNATSHYNAADVEDAMADRERSLDSIIDCSSLSVEADCIALLGFPFDDSSKRGTCRGMGCANAPKSLRGSFRKYKYGSLDNPEFAADLSHVRVVDVGDVLSGKCMDETYDNLSWAVSQLLLRRAVPFVFGGSNDLIYHSAAGLSSICAPKVASVVISAQLDTRLLDLPRFCGGDSDSSASSCEGRLVHFATQVSSLHNINVCVRMPLCAGDRSRECSGLPPKKSSYSLIRSLLVQCYV